MLYITALEAYNPIINCIKASAILLLSEIMLIRIHCHRYQNDALYIRNSWIA